MAGTDQGAEPTGWELMRALDAFRTDIKGDIAEVKLDVSLLGGKVISVDLYNADKQGNTARHQRAEGRITALETSAVDAEKQRRTTRLTIALAIASPLVSAALALLVKVVLP